MLISRKVLCGSAKLKSNSTVNDISFKKCKQLVKAMLQSILYDAASCASSIVFSESVDVLLYWSRVTYNSMTNKEGKDRIASEITNARNNSKKQWPNIDIRNDKSFDNATQQQCEELIKFSENMPLSYFHHYNPADNTRICKQFEKYLPCVQKVVLIQVKSSTTQMQATLQSKYHVLNNDRYINTFSNISDIANRIQLNISKNSESIVIKSDIDKLNKLYNSINQQIFGYRITDSFTLLQTSANKRKLSNQLQSKNNLQHNQSYQTMLTQTRIN